MTSIYFLRHGESEMNTRFAEIVSGRSNSTPLTEKGYEQARIAGKWLKQHDIKPTIAIVSPATRTVETLSMCLSAMDAQPPVVIEDQIQELSMGTMEGKLRKEVWDETQVTLLRKDPMNYVVADGESVADVQKRKLDWLTSVCAQYPDGTVLVVGHGNAIRALVGHFMKWTHRQTFHETPLPNCSLTHITCDSDSVVIDYVGRDIVSEDS